MATPCSAPRSFWDGILYLSRELIPEDEREISRDLFALIAYSWAVAAGKRGTYDPFDVLRTIRDRAWLGYADTPALIAQVRRDLPRAEVAGRMASYFGELAAKRGTYLFLPVVSRIDRHQLGPLPRQLDLDRTMADYSHFPAGGFGAPAFRAGAEYGTGTRPVLPRPVHRQLGQRRRQSGQSPGAVEHGGAAAPAAVREAR